MVRADIVSVLGVWMLAIGCSDTAKPGLATSSGGSTATGGAQAMGGSSATSGGSSNAATGGSITAVAGMIGGGGSPAITTGGTGPSAGGTTTSTAGSGGVPSGGASALAGASGSSNGGQGGAGTGGAPTGPATGTFPAITDPWMAGPFAVATMPGAGPSNNATVLYPRDLGKNGLLHPIVVWDNGAGQTGLSIYGALLNHLASHGFAVYAAYSATDQGTELVQGLDWMTAQAAASGSPFYQKLDTTKTAAMGHSQGSIATFAIAADPRLTTTIHLSGGTNPSIAQGHATLANLHHPAAFLCGEPGGDGLVVGDTASQWCAYDFDHTDVPVFLAQITGASHITAPGMTLGACAAWLRWRLMDDTTMRAQFAGTDCALCKRPNWVTKSKGL